jgi:hypothetical protein
LGGSRRFTAGRAERLDHVLELEKEILIALEQMR